MGKELIRGIPKTTPENSLKTLVENRTVYNLNHCEFNIFETHQQAFLVPLKFSDIVVTSMLHGKKVMHLFDDDPFEYLPGQSLIVAPNVEMKIDFPEAEKNNPTQCIALTVDQNTINNTLLLLNERYPRMGDESTWQLYSTNYFFENTSEVSDVITRLMGICMSADLSKDIWADLALQELLIRVIQSQNLKIHSNQNVAKNSSPLYVAIKYIREQIERHMPVSVTEVANHLCMSQPSLYRMFKVETGLSTVEFIISERIKKAKEMLKEPHIRINEVCFASGFDDCNYFIRMFKKQEGITPKQYRTCLLSNTDSATGNKIYN